MIEQKLRLLCLDGGGVRGLSSLYILKQLMEAVNPVNPPKPCNFFHMIGGTSTGGYVDVNTMFCYPLTCLGEVLSL
jgi:patatin-like phospholipase/acyl hydrolase